MRVWCRAVVLRGFVYFVRDHTRPTVPRGRSAAALRDDGEVPEILVTSEVTRVGKGLTLDCLMIYGFIWVMLMARRCSTVETRLRPRPCSELFLYEVGLV